MTLEINIIKLKEKYPLFHSEKTQEARLQFKRNLNADMKKILINFILVFTIVFQLNTAIHSVLINDTIDQEQDPNNSFGTKFYSKSQKISTKMFLINSPINIVNNSGFSLYDFPGNGTIDNPYIIENLTISNSSISNIVIKNVDVYFILRNSVLDGIDGNHTGISISNVNNSLITNNTITRFSNGIYLDISSNMSIVNNNIYDNSINGIFLSNSSNNSISCNYLNNNGENGIFIGSGAKFNTISSNKINNSAASGIYFGWFARFNIFIFNDVHDSHSGIRCYHSYSNEFRNNSLYNNHYGISLMQSGNNNITSNKIYNNSIGIISGVYGYNLIISNNYIFNNSNYGLDLRYLTSFCLITWNIFINNNYLTNNSSQVYADPDDFGIGTPTNNFLFNFWGEWTKPDINQDGIVDEPYYIDGSNATDPFPLTSTNKFVKNHFITYLNVQTSSHESSINELLFIYWNAAVDSFKNRVHYSLYYSQDFGINWIPIITETPYSYYRWNIELLDAGCYQLKVVAYSSSGLITEDISKKLALKMEHTLSAPEIIIPNSNYTLSEKISIQWTPAFDNCYYSVSYNISYSADGGGNWTLLATGIKTTSYIWDTSSIKNGNNYKIKVVAISSGRLISISYTEKALTVHNDAIMQFISKLPFYEIFFTLFIASELLILTLFLRYIRKKQNE